MSIPLSLAESISDFMLNTSWTTDGLVNNNILVSTKSKRDRKKARGNCHFLNSLCPV